MRTTIRVGWSQSLDSLASDHYEATCDVRFEVNPRHLETEPEAILQKVINACQACRQAVESGVALKRSVPPSRRSAASSPPTGAGELCQGRRRPNRRPHTAQSDMSISSLWFHVPLRYPLFRHKLVPG